MVMRCTVALLILLCGIFGIITHQENLLPVMPIIFSLFMLIGVFPRFKATEPGAIVFSVIGCIRYVLMPFLILFGDQSNSSYLDPIGIKLLLYEEVTVLLAFSFFYGRKFSASAPRALGALTTGSAHVFASLLVICAAGITLMSSAGVRAQYTSIFSERIAVETQSDPISGLFAITTAIGILLISPTLLSLIQPYIDRHPGIMYLVAIGSVGLGSLYISGTSRQSILIPLVAGFIVMTRLFPRYARSSMLILGVMGSLIMYVSSQLKSATTFLGASDGKSLVDFLNAYFSGPKNMSVAAEAVIAFDGQARFEVLISDLFGNVPGANLDLSIRSSEIFNAAFYGGGNIQDQIIPFFGQAMFHWSTLFAWIPIVLVIASLKIADTLYNRSQSVLGAYISAYSATVLGMIMMLNASILMGTLSQRVLPLLLVLLAAKLFPNRKIAVIEPKRNVLGSSST